MLAQITPADPAWLTPLLAYGPLGVICAVLLYFVIVYGPRLFESHLSFVRTCEDTQRKIATTLETLSETGTKSDENHKKTHDGLRHLASAAYAHTTKHTDYGSDVIIHCDNAKKTFEK